MTRRTRLALLAFTSVLSAALLAVVLANRELLRDPQPPDELPAMGQWLAEHPADWLTAGAISDAALDSEMPDRLELWRRAYGHAHMLAPLRPNSAAAFVRGGLFHWYELGEEDRARVLRAAGPLLRDDLFFARMHQPLWQLTRNFPFLRANAPDTPRARAALQELALSRGLFAEYRALREEIRHARMQLFRARRQTAEPNAVLALLPERIDRHDEPLARGVLEELERKAFEPDEIHHHVEPLVDYAVRHDLKPLTGVVPLLDVPRKLRDVTRARAALDLDRPAVATRIEITSAIADAAEWEPYYLDRARFEARRSRDATAADAYLTRAARGGMTLPVLAAARDVATILGNARGVARFEALLAQKAREPRAWSGTCAKHELCTTARAYDYAPGGTLRVAVAPVQSDETPPYVEIYVDDLRLAEGEVRDARTFSITTAPGLHQLEVRLVNPRTRNGVQRRVRLGRDDER